MSEETEYQTWHWRNTMKPVRFFMFDARAMFPCALLLVHFRLWTFILAAGSIFIFWVLERKGLTVPVALRALRVWFVGNYRPANYWFRRRKLLDTGSR